MNEAERKRHEDAGWQVGTVQEFLGLSDEEALYIELRVLLTEALKARRQAAKLSQKAFAKAMKSSQSRIAKAEANDPTVSVDLLVRSLIALGASLADLGKILDIQEAAVTFDSGARSRRSKRATSQSSKRKQTKQPSKTAKKRTPKAA